MAKPPETREMYGEIASLVGSLAKALEISEAQVISALERNEIAVDFGRDANGNAFITAKHGERTARVYQGAIKHAEHGTKP